MNNINGFTFYRSYFECLDKLPEEDQCELLRAIVYYVYKDENPELDGILSALWSVIKPNLDTSKNRSLNPQKQNQNKSKTKSKQTENKIKTKSKQNENNDLNDKDKEKEEDKEINKEIDKEGEIIRSITTTNIYEYLEQSFGRTISSIEIEKLDSWVKEFNEEIVQHAIDCSVLNNVKKFSYVEATLRNWKAQQYKTIEEIKENEDRFYNRGNREIDKSMMLFDYNWLEDTDE